MVDQRVLFGKKRAITRFYSNQLADYLSAIPEVIIGGEDKFAVNLYLSVWKEWRHVAWIPLTGDATIAVPNPDFVNKIGLYCPGRMSGR
jgi:hypothetical protein